MDQTFTEKELEVARILRMLPELLRECDRVRPPPQARAALPSLRWGSKKRRRSSAANPHQTHNSSPPPPPKTNSQASAAASDLEPAPPEAAPGTSRSSPASTISEEDPDHHPNVSFSIVAVAAGSPSPLPTGPYKKAKVQSKEWVEEQSITLASLRQQNQSLQQVAADWRVRHRALLAENSRLKEIRSKLEMEQMRDPPHQQQHPHCTYPSAWDSDRHHCREHRRLPLHQQQQEQQVGTATPQCFALHQRSNVDIRPRPLHPQPRRVAGGGGAVAGVKSPVSQRHGVAAEAEHQQPPRGHLDEAMRKATTEARKKRIEIKRRKAAVAVAAPAVVRTDGDRGVVDVAAGER